MKEESRRKIAQEAARLLYYNFAGEYKQAKEKASRRLILNGWPSNLEVALALNKIANEVEGGNREKLIIHLRREAFEIMKLVKGFHPKLIGSVWRGTARKGSDIDIEVFCENPDEVIAIIEKKYKNLNIEQNKMLDKEDVDRFHHVYFVLTSGHEVEIILKNIEKINDRRKCEVYGDFITGLTITQLEKILNDAPKKRFLPIAS